jgi:uncharacterized membrane protein YeaQ/YmgE (transglycosylase-associated protein family)
MLAAQLATEGKGYGALSPALIGILGGAVGCAVVALLRPGRRARAVGPSSKED